jgi:hypothetical protein
MNATAAAILIAGGLIAGAVIVTSQSTPAPVTYREPAVVTVEPERDFAYDCSVNGGTVTRGMGGRERCSIPQVEVEVDDPAPSKGWWEYGQPIP